MSIYYRKNDVFTYKGDTFPFSCKIKNLLPNTTYQMYLEINMVEKVKKDIQVITDENGIAVCVFPFVKDESKNYVVGKYSYGVKGCTETTEDTYFPTPFVKGYWYVLEEVVEGN